MEVHVSSIYLGCISDWIVHFLLSQVIFFHNEFIEVLRFCGVRCVSVLGLFFSSKHYLPQLGYQPWIYSWFSFLLMISWPWFFLLAWGPLFFFLGDLKVWQGTWYSIKQEFYMTRLYWVKESTQLVWNICIKFDTLKNI